MICVPPFCPLSRVSVCQLREHGNRHQYSGLVPETKMRRQVLIVASLATLLTGCATTAERAAQMQAEVDEMVAVYGPACDKLGFQNGTDPWRNCILGLSAQKTRERYLSTPRTSSCWGHRGFFSCSIF